MLPEKEIRNHRKLLSEKDRELAATFKVLGDTHRFRIFRILAEKPPVSVSSVAKILGISSPLASQHVKALASTRLLTKSRSGKKIYLQLDLHNPIVEELVLAVRRTVRTPSLKKTRTKK